VRWVRDIPRVSMLFALAIRRVLQRAGLNEVRIKWPNDIFVHGRKCAGILCDIGATLEQVDYLIAGIGINVNMSSFPSDMENQATSIRMELGHAVDRMALIADVYNEIYRLMEQYMQDGDFDVFHREYCENCFVLGQPVTILHPHASYVGIVEHIDSNGILLLRLEDGTKKTFLSGDVSLRMANNERA
jgi:birA, biotin-[acetyl-CoA-carboxylase] ligase region